MIDHVLCRLSDRKIRDAPACPAGTEWSRRKSGINPNRLSDSGAQKHDAVDAVQICMTALPTPRRQRGTHGIPDSHTGTSRCRLATTAADESGLHACDWGMRKPGFLDVFLSVPFRACSHKERPRSFPGFPEGSGLNRSSPVQTIWVQACILILYE